MSDTRDRLMAQVQAILEESLALKARIVREQAGALVTMAELIAAALGRGGKLLLCGNGGSAADAQHIAAEFVVRLRPGRERRALPALALHTDTSTLTAAANDFGYEFVFSRMIEALGNADDVLVALSTSGESKNVLGALAAARGRSMKTLGLLGSDGGAAREMCDLALVVPSRDPGRVQEVHIMVGHSLAELVETILFEGMRDW